MFESDKDVNRMAGRLASRTLQEGHVHLGTIMIKKLQALMFWCKDHQMHGVDLVAAEFDQAALDKAMEGKRVCKEAKETELAPLIKDIEKFNPDKFEMLKLKVGHGLKLLTCPKMVKQPINNGQIIIMGQANLTSILNMPKLNLTHFITKMKGLFHLNSSQERSNDVLQ